MRLSTETTEHTADCKCIECVNVRERSLDEFGRCPRCGKNDGYLNVGREHWFVCHTHRVKWCYGDNLFSSWREQSDETFRQNAARLEIYLEIEPMHEANEFGSYEDSEHPEWELDAAGHKRCLDALHPLCGVFTPSAKFFFVAALAKLTESHHDWICYALASGGIVVNADQSVSFAPHTVEKYTLTIPYADIHNAVDWRAYDAADPRTPEANTAD